MERAFPERLELGRSDRLGSPLEEAFGFSALADSSLFCEGDLLEPMAKAATATRAQKR